MNEYDMKALAYFEKPQKGPCKVFVYQPPENHRGLMVMIQNKDGFTDWPIMYADGRIVYDFPERFPKYAKRLVIDAFSWIGNHTTVKCTGYETGCKCRTCSFRSYRAERMGNFWLRGYDREWWSEHQLRRKALRNKGE